MPIFIRYFTVEGKKGKLQFYDDIYGEDRALRDRYFAQKPISDKRITCLFLLPAAVFGQHKKPVKVQFGIASYYADKFEGRKTFTDEIFCQDSLTAASNTLPMHTWVRVTKRISPGYSKVASEPGMIVSNEPGVYFAGEYGIRIENLCLISEAIPHIESGPHDGPFYTFIDLTKVPYARNLIDLSLLSPQEIQWIDEYHREIYELYIDDLNDDQRDWLALATAPLEN